MSFLRHKQIYQSDVFDRRTQGGVVSGFAPGTIVSMSLQPAIPWRVALLQGPPPLYQPMFIVDPVVGTVNHHPTGAGEFSTGTMGNFQPVLTPLAEARPLDEPVAGAMERPVWQCRHTRGPTMV
jgi:hypothetical protein